MAGTPRSGDALNQPVWLRATTTRFELVPITAGSVGLLIHKPGSVASCIDHGIIADRCHVTYLTQF